jgi:predicted transcriptional regulator
VLIQLLDYLQSGKTYSIQELADLLHKDIDSVWAELEYLENQGYIRKVTSQPNCTQNCKGCHGCDQPAITVDTWEVVKQG